MDAVIEILPGDGLDQGSHDAGPEVGIAVDRAGGLVIPVAFADFLGGNQIPERVPGAGIAAVGIQGGGMRHQHAQGDGRLPGIGVAHGIAQIGGNILIQLQQTLLHQLHDMDAGDKLGDGGDPEVGGRGDGHFFLFGRVAILILIDDFAIPRNDHGGAGGFIVPEDPAERLGQAVTVLRRGPGGAQQQAEEQGREAGEKLSEGHRPFSDSMIFFSSYCKREGGTLASPDLAEGAVCRPA